MNTNEHKIGVSEEFLVRAHEQCGSVYSMHIYLSFHVVIILMACLLCSV